MSNLSKSYLSWADRMVLLLWVGGYIEVGDRLGVEKLGLVSEMEPVNSNLNVWLGIDWKILETSSLVNLEMKESDRFRNGVVWVLGTSSGSWSSKPWRSPSWPSWWRTPDPWGPSRGSLRSLGTESRRLIGCERPFLSLRRIWEKFYLTSKQ